MAATEIFLNTPVAVGNIGVKDYAAYRLTLDAPVALLLATAEDGGGGGPTSACFWAEESIDGLVKDCPPPA